MRVCYHVTIPPSPMADCEAVAQDVRLLQRIAPGERFHLYPTRAPGTRIPRLLWGLNQLPALWRAERSIDLHHVFNPDPFPFLALRLLRRPIVYTVVGGINETHREMARRLAQFAHTIIVSSEADYERLRAWGIARGRFVQPAIETSGFSYTPTPADAPLTLLAGSAPWTVEQFTSKGVDVLLEVARNRPNVRLVFLWRGVVFDEMMRRVSALGLEQRVCVLNEKVDVNRVLAGVHASVVLATRSDVVKAYPHSLLESLAAGKPVLVSRVIPMARWVEQAGLGLVIDQADVEHVLNAIAALQSSGMQFQAERLRASVADQTRRFIEQHEQVYRQAVDRQLAKY
ncbi:MAG: glycosyltransferase [Anaerolineae bacterium]